MCFYKRQSTKLVMEMFPDKDIHLIQLSHDEEFHKRLLDSVMKIAITSNDSDPEHNFLIGLAYFEGIDVEIDKERGIVLIT